MADEYLLVKPTAAGQRFVSVDDGFGGFDLNPESPEELKAALGIPLNTFIGGGYFSYYGGSDISEVDSTIYNDFGINLTISVGVNGSYGIQLGQSYALSKGFGKFQYEYNSILNNLPTGYTLDIDETTHGWQLQFKNGGVNANLPTDILIPCRFKVFIQQWKT